MVYYNLPTVWSEDVEAQIVEQVHQSCRRIQAAVDGDGSPTKKSL
jgi:hypothetical protein